MADIGYVSLEDANTYITSHFLSTDPLRVAWVALAEANKTVLLTVAFESIETLPFAGRKTSCDQAAAFPRWPDTEVPTDVESAQVENAIALCITDESDAYKKMWRYGVTSYSIGNFSESIDKKAGSAEAVAEFQSGIVSAKALQLLKPYMSGGYTIRR